MITEISDFDQPRKSLASVKWIIVKYACSQIMVPLGIQRDNVCRPLSIASSQPSQN